MCMKNLFFFPFLLFFSTVFAHQPDISTTLLFQRDDGKWMLQITSSLTAFQAEVKTRFSENAYASVEDFQRLVQQHLRENVLFCLNGSDTLLLGNAFVKVGHETSVVFEVQKMPETITTVLAQNTSFKHIHRNQSALIVLKKGFPKQHFVLNDDNAQRVNLVFDGQKLVLAPAAPERSAPQPGVLLLAILGLFSGVAALVWGRPAFIQPFLRCLILVVVPLGVFAQCGV